MIRSARTIIASKVNKIEPTEDFNFARWLRPPKIINQEVKPVYLYEEVKEIPVEKIPFPTLAKLKIRILQPNIPANNPAYFIERSKSYLIFFGLTKPRLYVMIEKLLQTPHTENINLHFDNALRVIDQSDRFIVKAAVPKNFIFTFSDVAAKDFPFYFSVPEVTDHLASLVPQIYNIELLNIDKIEDVLVESKAYDIKKIFVPAITKISVPNIDDITSSVSIATKIKFDYLQKPKIKSNLVTHTAVPKALKVKFDSPKSIVKKVVIKQQNLQSKVSDPLSDKNVDDFTKENIKSLLSSFREIKWEDYSKSLQGLNEYEIESAGFLTENNFAVLCDELGIDKFDQTIAALSFLTKKSSVRNAILVSEQYRVESYWENLIKKFGKELLFKKIEPNTFVDLTKNGSVGFIDVKDLSNLPVNELQKVDLIIFDELVDLESSAKIIDEMVLKTEPDKIWFLSPVINEKHQNAVIEKFEFASKVSFNFKGISYDEACGEDLHTSYKNIWLHLDEMQSFEYSEAISQARAELLNLMESTNPLRFHSNVFTIVHKVKQILNFASFRNISPKANLLLEQISAINKNRKKAVVFTQYDANGIKKIEKALELNSVKFASARNGMSEEELKSSIKSFYNKHEVSVLVTNLKPSRLNINLSKINYLINFDQWWNPVTVWQNYDELGLSDNYSNPILVYNYNIRGSIEDGILNLLEIKGLLNKQLFDNLKSETISEMISMEEWGAVFGLNSFSIQTYKKDAAGVLSKLQKLDLDGFKELMKSFFTLLGYRDLNISDSEDDPNFYLTGASRKGTTPVHLHCKCSLLSKVMESDYADIKSLKQSNTEILRKFVITNGEIPARTASDITFIEGNDLANYIITVGLKARIPKKK